MQEEEAKTKITVAYCHCCVRVCVQLETGIKEAMERLHIHTYAHRGRVMRKQLRDATGTKERLEYAFVSVCSVQLPRLQRHKQQQQQQQI